MAVAISEKKPSNRMEWAPEITPVTIPAIATANIRMVDCLSSACSPRLLTFPPVKTFKPHSAEGFSGVECTLCRVLADLTPSQASQRPHFDRVNPIKCGSWLACDGRDAVLSLTWPHAQSQTQPRSGSPAST